MASAAALIVSTGVRQHRLTPSERLALTWALAVSTGAFAQLLARLTSLPGVVVLLLAGMVMGRQGFGLIEPLDLGAGLETAVSLLVAVVLFEGGMTLRFPHGWGRSSLQQLVGVGLPLTWLLGTLAAHSFAGLDWRMSGLYAAIVAPTGPTVVTPLVRHIRLQPALGRLLEGEGLLREPIAAVAAVLLLQFVLEPYGTGWALLVSLLQRILLGSLVGAACGWLLAELLRRLPQEQGANLRLQLTLGMLLLVEVLCELFVGTAVGLPAAVVAGLVVGSRPAAAPQDLELALRQMAALAVTLLFPLLAADVTLSELSPLGVGGVTCVLSLMLLVRPLVVALGTLGSDLNLRQRAFIAWLAPRGIVSASAASLFAIRLEQEGVLGAGRLQGLVFLTILMTVSLQGLSAGPLARRLGLVEAESADPSPAVADASAAASPQAGTLAGDGAPALSGTSTTPAGASADLLAVEQAEIRSSH